MRRDAGIAGVFAAILFAALRVDAEPVPDGYHRIATAHGIPTTIFYAVALAESGRHIDRVQGTRPWPWTLNVQGKGRHYASRQAALDAARVALASGRKSIDFGLMQVNWTHHASALRSIEAALDPYHNLDVAARILTACFRQRGDWWAAVGCYHAPSDPDRAASYRDRVRRIWSRIMALG